MFTMFQRVQSVPFRQTEQRQIGSEAGNSTVGCCCLCPPSRTHQTHTCTATIRQHKHTWTEHLLGTHTHTRSLSSRQQGLVSDHVGAWICSVVRANDLRHMSGPCGFKTKHCQERSALAGQPAPCSAVLCMQQAIQSSKSKTEPIIIPSHRSVLCPYRLL